MKKSIKLELDFLFMKEEGNEDSIVEDNFCNLYSFLSFQFYKILSKINKEQEMKKKLSFYHNFIASLLI